MHRAYRRVRWLFSGALAFGMLGGCWSNDLFQRFREGYAPGFIEGLTTAVLTPGDWETGLRRAWAAIFEGLGSVLQPLSSSSGSGSSGS